MPMAGLGSRFDGHSQNTIKPLIDIKGKPMFQLALSSIISKIKGPVKLVFIIRKVDDEKYNFEAELLKVYPDSTVVKLEDNTRGPLETAGHAFKHLDQEKPVFVLDCDFLFSCEKFFKMYESSEFESPYLLTFVGGSERYSYAKLDADNRVIQVAEKVVISDRAIAGAYFFHQASTLISNGESILKAEHLVKGEFYLSTIYQRIIENGGEVGHLEMDGYLSFGTPEELEKSYKDI